MIAHGSTDVGRIRANNQDAFFLSTTPVGELPNLFIVADGMGGHLAGEVASSQAVSAFTNHLQTQPAVPEGLLDFLIEATQVANAHVYRQSITHLAYKGMGTTFTALSLIGSKGYVAHLGDSRLYQLKQGSFKQITQDHSYVEALVRTGQITLEEAQHHPQKNLLTRVLGSDLETPVDGYLLDIQPGDWLLLCSDGLSNMLSDTYISNAIQADNTVESIVTGLIAAANDSGGVDNITCILIKIEGEPHAA